jgi:integrase
MKAARNTIKSRVRPKPPGSIYVKRNRYYWCGRLGEQTISRAVAPAGSKYALPANKNNEQVAYEIIWRWIEADQSPVPAIRTVADLRKLYLAHCHDYYRRSDGTPTGEAANVEAATRLLVSRFGNIPADALHRSQIRQMIDEWISRGLARTTINKYTNIIKRMYRWASDDQGYVPASTYYDIAIVRNLTRRSPAREPDPIGLPDEAAVDRTLTRLPLTLWRMVMLHRLTGMRSTELCIMRPCDIDQSGEIWVYTPAWHKEMHLGQERHVPLGPIAQWIIAPLMNRPPNAYLFSPREVMQERWQAMRLNRKSSVQPSQVNRSQGLRRYAERYDRRSYYLAVIRAQGDDASWHPHQLRHAFITRVKRLWGVEAARASGGHASLDATEIYVEKDLAMASDVARYIG